MTRIVSGAQTYSKAPSRYPANAPRYARSAHGCVVACDDGREYVDTVSALGAVALGHGWPDVERAACQQLALGVSFSLPTRLEEALAERVCWLIPNATDWLVRFAKNGNDATNAAVRIARAATGRDYVLYNAYHGHADWCMTEPPKNGGIPAAVCVLSQRVPDSLVTVEHYMRRRDVACVVLEPIVSADPRIPVPGYFRDVRKLCDNYGALLIVDEMVTGLRAGFLGAVATYGIKPDLVCYGKAIANGWPLSVLAGKPEYMERIERDVFFSTTFGGEAVSLAAALATLRVCEHVDATDRIQQMAEQIGGAFAESAGDLATVTALAGRVTLKWRDPECGKRWAFEMVARGILTQGYVNVMLAHEHRGAQRIVTAAREAFAEIRADRKVAA